MFLQIFRNVPEQLTFASTECVKKEWVTTVVSASQDLQEKIAIKVSY